ncbi:MAG: DUF3450 family protein [Myxococcales bacterium]|nr:DUF3450 family protein [Myxococcales bacterium]
MATELARLRSEVETLASQVEEKKDSLRSQLRALSMQRSAMALSLEKERLRLRALQKQIREQQARVKSASEEGSQLAPLALKVASLLKAQIEKSLPFRLKERIKVISEIVQKLHLKVMTPRQALARLWQAAEDELRLGRENGLYNQIILLDGKPRLVQVARLGMVMLFFRTRDARVGAAQKQGGQWSFVIFRQPEKIKQVETLFDGLKKQIRMGYWTIPNALPR